MNQKLIFWTLPYSVFSAHDTTRALWGICSYGLWWILVQDVQVCYSFHNLSTCISFNGCYQHIDMSFNSLICTNDTAMGSGVIMSLCRLLQMWYVSFTSFSFPYEFSFWLYFYCIACLSVHVNDTISSCACLLPEMSQTMIFVAQSRLVGLLSTYHWASMIYRLNSSTGYTDLLASCLSASHGLHILEKGH